jgi:hypothetical protein
MASNLLPIPRYRLHQKVRHQLFAGEGWSGPMRVIGQHVENRLGVHPTVRYDLQPWDLSGTWMLDRPVAGVFEQHMEAC